MKTIALNRREASLLWLLVERAAPLPKDNTVAHLRAVDAIIDALEPFVTDGDPKLAPILLGRLSIESTDTPDEEKDAWYFKYGDCEPKEFSFEDAHLEMAKEMWKGQGGQAVRAQLRAVRWKRALCYGLDAQLNK